MEKLLALRKKIKARKPTFVRQESHKFKRLEGTWRRPKGIHSKMRNKRKGNPLNVKVGYGSPRAAHGLTHTGLIPIIVFSAGDIEKLDAKKHSATIGSSVGKQKRIMLVELLHKKGVSISNIKDPKGYRERVESELKARRESRIDRAKQKEAREKKQKAEKENAKAAKHDKKSAAAKEHEHSSKEDSKQPGKSEDEEESKRLEAEKVMIHNQG